MMNMTTDRTFEGTIPAGAGEAEELVSKTKVAMGSTIKLAPRTTAVIYLPEEK